MTFDGFRDLVLRAQVGDKQALGQVITAFAAHLEREANRDMDSARPGKVSGTSFRMRGCVLWKVKVGWALWETSLQALRRRQGTGRLNRGTGKPLPSGNGEFGEACRNYSRAWSAAVVYRGGRCAMDEEFHALVEQARCAADSPEKRQAQEKLCRQMACRLQQGAKKCLGRHATPDQVDDLIQETWLRALRYLKQVRGDSRGIVTEPLFGAWLGRIMKNFYYNRKKDEDRHNPEQNGAIPIANSGKSSSFGAGFTPLAQGSSPSQQAQRTEAEELLRQALDALEEKYREVVELRIVEGLPFTKIAARLGRDQGTVSKYYTEALRILKAKLPGLRSSLGGAIRGGQPTPRI
jgi:RNA polymerase sigma factor (sigma-70 family)